MANLPYQNTKVSMSITMAHIEAALQDIGFERIGRLTENGNSTVLASSGNASFKWQADIAAVKKAYAESFVRGPRRAMTDEQASRIAWRYVWFSVKAVTDAIKLGIINISDGFGGYAMLKDGKTVGEELIRLSSEGKLQKTSIGLLMEGTD